MLQTVTIQNYKSLRDATVKLQKVNLLIGPNNSGKSNFLKGLMVVNDFYNHQIQFPRFDFDRIYYRQLHRQTVVKKNPIKFSFCWADQEHPFSSGNVLYQLELLSYDRDGSNSLVYNEGYGISKDEIKIDLNLLDIESRLSEFNEFNSIHIGEYLNRPQNEEIVDYYKSEGRRNLWLSSYEGLLNPRSYPYANGTFLKKAVNSSQALNFDLEDFLLQASIYKPDPSKIAKESLLLFDKHVNEDCSNLVAFLDNMRDEHPNVWKAIEQDLNRCIPDFEGINFGKVSIRKNNSESIGKRFGLRDRRGKTYWADELSEGTVYFLALLAIVHQPSPPKILLLEEPEKGIHPRRIKEVMDLIFRLAEEKDIQIVLTSHSTQVVDAFQDIPESVFVFDMVDGETKIKNLQTDILEKDEEDAGEKGFPKIDYSKRSLGEHWAIGLLGGVPV